MGINLKRTLIGSLDWKGNRTNLVLLFISTCLLLFFCSKMSPLYPLNDWSDINLYFNIGKAMMNGRILYTEVFDHKGPLIFFIYSAGYLISNNSFLGMFIIECLLWVAMVYAVYFCTRLYLNSAYSFLVTLLFPIFFLSHTWEGGSAEEFIGVFQLISLCLFVAYFRRKEAVVHKPSGMFIHGVLFSMTLFIKLNLVVFWLFPILFIFINILLGREYRNVFYNILAFLLGVLFVALPICIYLYANEALTEAWQVYIVLNKKYANLGNISEITSWVTTRFYQRLRFETFEFLIILLGAFYFPFHHIEHQLGKLAVALSFCCLFTVVFMTPGYVYYYSVPYYIYCGLGLTSIFSIIQKKIKIKSSWYFYAFCLFIALWVGVRQRNFYGMKPEILLRSEEPQGSAFQFAKHIRKEKAPTLLNLGLDLGCATFTVAQIVPNTKYFVSPNLGYGIYPQMRDAQTRYIENKEVLFVILSEGSINYDYFKKLPALQGKNYTLIDSYLDGIVTYYLYKRIN